MLDATGYTGQWIGLPPAGDPLQGRNFASLPALRAAVGSALGTGIRLRLAVYWILSKVLHLVRPCIRMVRRPALLRQSASELLAAARRVVRDRRNAFSGMQDLLVYMSTVPVSAGPAPGALVIEPIDALLLRVFATAGLIPGVEPMHIAGLSDAEHALSAAQAGGRRLLVQAGIYIRFYAVFKRAAQSGLTIV